MAKISTDIAKYSSYHKSITRLGRGGYSTARLELIRTRADLLSPADRSLVRMYIDKGSTFTQIARIKGLSEGTVARRIRKLIAKLLDGRYVRCLRNKEHFTDLQLAMARDYLLEDKPLRTIARKRNLSLYRVRKDLKYIIDIVNSS